MVINPHLFEAFLKCPTKCWLRSQGEPGEGNDYAAWMQSQNETYRSEGIRRLLEGVPQNECVTGGRTPESLRLAKWRLAVDLLAQTPDLESRLHAVERLASGGRGKPAQFIPIRFVFTNKLSRDDRLLVAFDALTFSEMLGREVSLARIIHGDDHATLKVKTSGLMGEVRNRVEKMCALLSNSSPPDVVLNRHCAECEFQTPCRQKAVEKDDLSLLAGMSEKERSRHRSKGIFTITQLSYTFRPRRTPKRAKNPAKPRYFALQALAIREDTIYIHGTPELPESISRVYLDIEGLPDREFNYLIGALIVTPGQEVFHSLWADAESDQASIFAQFAEIVAPLSDCYVFHFGDYDAVAMKRIMADLAEGPRQQVATILHRAVNVLSVIYPHVYFPTFSNGLKELSKHIGYEHPAWEATGLQSIIWRKKWEADRDPDLKAKLMDYNKSDCLILRYLTEFIASQTSQPSSWNPHNTKVSHTHAMTTTRRHWQMFAAREYALEDFKRVVTCSYFDYQRERVFVRTDRQLRTINNRHRKLKR